MLSRARHADTQPFMQSSQVTLSEEKHLFTMSKYSPFAQIESGFKELLSQKVGLCTVGHQPSLTWAKIFNFKLKHVYQVGKEHRFIGVF